MQVCSRFWFQPNDQVATIEKYSKELHDARQEFENNLAATTSAIRIGDVVAAMRNRTGYCRAKCVDIFRAANDQETETFKVRRKSSNLLKKNYFKLKIV